MKKYEGVLQRVRDLEFKRGISYANTDGKLYKASKVLCIIMAVWALLTNVFFILGHLLMYAGTDNMSSVMNRIITVSVCTLAVIASLILNKFKIYIVSGVINVISSVLLCLQFANLLTDDLGFLGLKPSFYFRHLIPLALMSLFIVVMTIVAVRARIKTDRMYKKVTENLYNMYRINEADAADMSDEQWDDFLKNYNPHGKVNIVNDIPVEQENEG